jgi:hypothetical protein
VMVIRHVLSWSGLPQICSELVSILDCRNCLKLELTLSGGQETTVTLDKWRICLRQNLRHSTASRARNGFDYRKERSDTCVLEDVGQLHGNSANND